MNRQGPITKESGNGGAQLGQLGPLRLTASEMRFAQRRTDYTDDVQFADKDDPVFAAFPTHHNRLLQRFQFQCSVRAPSRTSLRPATERPRQSSSATSKVKPLRIQAVRRQHGPGPAAANREVHLLQDRPGLEPIRQAQGSQVVQVARL